MTDKQVWLITGAGRGLGIDIAKAALAAGHAVVGTAPVQFDARPRAASQAVRPALRGVPIAVVGLGQGRADDTD